MSSVCPCWKCPCIKSPILHSIFCLSACTRTGSCSLRCVQTPEEICALTVGNNCILAFELLGVCVQRFIVKIDGILCVPLRTKNRAGRVQVNKCVLDYFITLKVELLSGCMRLCTIAPLHYPTYVAMELEHKSVYTSKMFQYSVKWRMWPSCQPYSQCGKGKVEKWNDLSSLYFFGFWMEPFSKMCYYYYEHSH